MKDILKNKTIKRLTAAVFWLAVWTAAAAAVGQELLVPGPIAVAKRLASLIVTGSFWEKVLFSFLRVIGGFAAGCVLGIVCAVLSYFSVLFETVADPFIRIVKSTPVASFIILVALWTDSGMLPAVIAGIVVLPVIYFGVLSGMRAADPKLLEMARAFSFSRSKKIRLIYAPTVIPFISPAAVTGLGLAWKSGVAAEVLAVSARSIGAQIYYSKVYWETADLFAWTVVIVILSLAFERLLTRFISGKEGPENDN